MHLPRVIRAALLLLFGAAVSTAFLAPKPGAPGSPSNISKRSTDGIDGSQPPATAPTPTVHDARNAPLLARDRTTHVAGRDIPAHEDYNNKHGTHNANTGQAEAKRQGGTALHRRDIAGIEPAGFIIMVTIGSIAFLVAAWFTFVYWKSKGKTAVIR